MPLSTDIKLPKDYPPTFPSICVVCGSRSPDSTVQVITGTIGWWSWLLWSVNTPFRVKAPACRRCRWRLHRLRLASLLVSAALVFMAYRFLWPFVPRDIPFSARKWALLGIGLGCLIPQIVYELCFPHPFSITAHQDSIDYEFRDPAIAAEFALLNQATEWEEDNGNEPEHVMEAEWFTNNLL